MSPDVPDGSIVITPKEFYDGVRQDIADIKKGIEPLADTVRRVGRLESELAVLRQKLYVLVGAASVLGAASGAALGRALGG
ncbi:MAG TPA: hypothetical protein VFV01_47810 [Spirillospora sp.]|nr:hypothetical protein [Spirillospora sp.]